MRTRLIVTMVAVMALFAGQEVFAKTRGPVAALQGALTGSVRKAVTVAVTRPVTTPLLEWARNAAEKARIERRNWKTQQTPVNEADDSEFSRDRD